MYYQHFQKVQSMYVAPVVCSSKTCMCMKEHERSANELIEYASSISSEVCNTHIIPDNLSPSYVLQPPVLAKPLSVQLFRQSRWKPSRRCFENVPVIAVNGCSKHASCSTSLINEADKHSLT